MTVVIPAFNAVATIERAVASALAEGDIDLECVVVDDGSTDATAAVVARLAAHDPRVVIVSAPANSGPSVARNRALDIARGTWLTFVDADDRLLPGGLAAMVRAGVDGEAAVVVGQRIWTDGRWRWRSAAYDIPDIRRPGRASLVTRPGLVAYASATGKLVRRSLVEDLRFDGRVLGDQPWTIRALIRAGDRIVVVGDDVYEWARPRRGAATASITASKARSSRLAAEAARVAIGALAAVRAEAQASMPDPAARDRVVRAYFDRVVEQDLGGPVRRAATGGDAGADELFEAVGEFLDAAPRALVDESQAVARAIIRQPLDRWFGFGEPGRSAYLGLVRWLLDDHPGLAPLAARGTLLGPALTQIRRSAGPAPATARLVIALDWPVGAVGRVVRLVRLGLVRVRTLRPARG